MDGGRWGFDGARRMLRQPPLPASPPQTARERGELRSGFDRVPRMLRQPPLPASPPQTARERGELRSGFDGVPRMLRQPPPPASPPQTARERGELRSGFDGVPCMLRQPPPPGPLPRFAGEGETLAPGAADCCSRLKEGWARTRCHPETQARHTLPRHTPRAPKDLACATSQLGRGSVTPPRPTPPFSPSPHVVCAGRGPRGGAP
jgi:hypothetical protein